MRDGATAMLIAVEGIDGSGKTTTVDRLALRLEAAGRRVIVVRRYHVPELTRLWHHLVEQDAIDQDGAALLAASDFAIGLRHSIVPALEDGRDVVADRYVYSHKVHFAARGVPEDRLRALFAAAPTPDRVVLLDTPAAVALRRLRPLGKPDFWEAALDHRLAPTIGRAWRRFRDSPPPRAEVESHFLDHQASCANAFRRLLPVGVTLALDGTLPPDGLVERISHSLSSR
jgi:dTMP kinase